MRVVCYRYARIPLTPAEKETIFLWSEADDNVQITTYNRSLIKRLRDAHERSPELYHLKGPDCYGGFDAEMPRELLQNTFVTMALENGINIKILSDMIGHSSAETTVNVRNPHTNKM